MNRYKYLPIDLPYFLLKLLEINDFDSTMNPFSMKKTHKHTNKNTIFAAKIKFWLIILRLKLSCSWINGSYIYFHCLRLLLLSLENTWLAWWIVVGWVHNILVVVDFFMDFFIDDRFSFLFWLHQYQPNHK